jgi:hypothetical protein
MKEQDALRPGTGKAHARGLSKSDYCIARRLINEGLVTEQELIDAGKMLPSKGRGRPSTGAREWFLEARKTKQEPEVIKFTMEPDAHPVVKQIARDLAEGNQDIVVERVEDGVEL